MDHKGPGYIKDWNEVEKALHDWATSLDKLRAHADVVGRSEVHQLEQQYADLLEKFHDLRSASHQQVSQMNNTLHTLEEHAQATSRGENKPPEQGKTKAFSPFDSYEISQNSLEQIFVEQWDEVKDTMQAALSRLTGDDNQS